MKKIVLTGGHAGTTAIATIEEFKKNKITLKWSLIWIGPATALEGKSVTTLEYKVLPNLGVSFHKIYTGRLQRRLSLWTIPSLLKIPFGFFHALFLLITIKPGLIISFGGYAAFPVVAIGYLLRIPIIIHEQTTGAGLSNRLSALLATKVAIARDESRVYFPKRKTVRIGNPILTNVARVKPKRFLGNPPHIFILGGSRGSETINSTLDKILPKLLRIFSVDHMTGEPSYQYFKDRKKTLGERYNNFKFIDPSKIDKFYAKSDIVIARSGANTVSEIMATRRPSILIPIPWVQNNEQAKNASLAQKQGISIILEESKLTPETLFRQIMYVLKNWQKMQNTKRSELTELDLVAAKRLVTLSIKLSK